MDGAEKKVLGVGGIVRQILQICSDYNGLPDVRTMELYEIRFFYEPSISGLIKIQKEMKKK